MLQFFFLDSRPVEVVIPQQIVVILPPANRKVSQPIGQVDRFRFPLEHSGQFQVGKARCRMGLDGRPKMLLCTGEITRFVAQATHSQHRDEIVRVQLQQFAEGHLGGDFAGFQFAQQSLP